MAPPSEYGDKERSSCIRLFGNTIPLSANTDKRSYDKNNDHSNSDFHKEEREVIACLSSGSSIVSDVEEEARGVRGGEEKKAKVSSDSESKPIRKLDMRASCPRCNSLETKFCYFNNYNVNQPRHFCKGCLRYWTEGGSLRSVPFGAGRRKGKLAPIDKQPQSFPHCESAKDKTGIDGYRVNPGDGTYEFASVGATSALQAPDCNTRLYPPVSASFGPVPCPWRPLDFSDNFGPNSNQQDNTKAKIVGIDGQTGKISQDSSSRLYPLASMPFGLAPPPWRPLDFGKNVVPNGNQDEDTKAKTRIYDQSANLHNRVYDFMTLGTTSSPHLHGENATDSSTKLYRPAPVHFGLAPSPWNMLDSGKNVASNDTQDGDTEAKIGIDDSRANSRDSSARLHSLVPTPFSVAMCTWSTLDFGKNLVPNNNEDGSNTKVKDGSNGPGADSRDSSAQLYAPMPTSFSMPLWSQSAPDFSIDFSKNLAPNSNQDGDAKAKIGINGEFALAPHPNIGNVLNSSTQSHISTPMPIGIVPWPWTPLDLRGAPSWPHSIPNYGWSPPSPWTPMIANPDVAPTTNPSCQSSED